MFTTSAYIRKNTPELRERLEQIGLYMHPTNNEKTISNGNFLFVNRGFYNNGVMGYTEEVDMAIDCGSNETLFLAIAALRNDSDYMQWFCDYRGENWVQCTEQVCRGSREWHTEHGILHKASVEELVKHFSK